MIRTRFLLPLAVAFVTFLATPSIFSQEINWDIKGEGHTDTLGTALVDTFAVEYDIVFKATRTALEKLGYEVNYASKKRNLIETSFRVLTEEPTFHDTMNVYGEVPYMRSPGWTIGRTKVTVNLDRSDSTRVGVKVVALLSGFEARFTNQWHYWKSNGLIEKIVVEAIKREVTAGATP